MSDVVTVFGYNAATQLQCSWHSVLWNQPVQILTWKLEILTPEVTTEWQCTQGK